MSRLMWSFTYQGGADMEKQRDILRENTHLAMTPYHDNLSRLQRVKSLSQHSYILVSFNGMSTIPQKFCTTWNVLRDDPE